MGLSATGVRMEYAQLQNCSLPGIAHVNGDHFLVITESNAQGVEVMDYPAPARKLSREEFSRMWKGEFLLFGKTSQKRMQC